MCYPLSSTDQTTNCPMCTVFIPSGSRCPHIRDICRNRTAHPEYDVVYIKNAEVASFAGCGYCKWARLKLGYYNSGMPGCCRAPVSALEQRLIPAADWKAVNIVHHVPIPPDIKALLDSITSRGSQFTASPNSGRGGASPSMPSLDRRSSATTSPTNKTINPAGRTSPKVPSIPAKRGGGSPQQNTSSLSGSRRSGSPSASNDYYQAQRRGQSNPERRSSPSNSNRPSPDRKLAELTSISKRSVTNMAKAAAEAEADPPPSRRRGGTVSQSNPNGTNHKSHSPNSRPSERNPPTSTRSHAKKPSLEMNVVAAKLSSVSLNNTNGTKISSASSSSGSSDSLGSMTDSTVHSDGFTDYLSDESEAEMQRQAEAKAVLVAQNMAEEQEFKAARQQLTYVDLRPPKSWNPGSNPTRLASTAPYVSSAYSSVPFTSSPMAQAAGSKLRG